VSQRVIRAIRGNLVAWLALFVAMGGTSLAASHFVITSTKQIKPSVLKKLKGKQGARGAQGLQGVPGQAGPAGTVNGAHFTEGEGSQGGRWQELVSGSSSLEFLAVPGIGEIAIKCNAATHSTGVKLTEIPSSTVFLTWGSYPTKQPIKMETDVLKADNPSLEQAFGATESGTGQMIIQASAGLTTSLHTFATITVSPSVTEGFCRFQANYTESQQQF
jgi:hypothetical protein